MERIDGLLKAQAEARPDALAILDWDGRAWSFAEEFAGAEAAAELLRSKGVQAGDRVLLVTENCATLTMFIFACSLMGAWAIPVNARQTAPELQRTIEHATPRLGVFMSNVSSDAEAHGARFDAQYAEGKWGAVHVAELGPSDPAHDEDVAVLLYTTGTTGTPKGVMLTHGNLVYAAHASVERRSLVPDDIMYGVLPMTHVFGLASMMMAATCAGSTIRLEARFTAERLFNGLSEGVTVLPAVPQMHALLMQYTRERGAERLEGGKLRYVSSGGAPLDPIWKSKAEEFYGVALQNGYGLTESTAGICSTLNAKGDPDISVGPPLPRVEMAIDESVEGGGNGTGEVLSRGPHVMRGYFRNAEETGKVLDAEGWLRTGDLGRIDERGFLHILGRSKELIIHGGFNIYPPEVEAALNDHPMVVQSAVVGRRTQTGDEEVLAFVQVPSLDAVSAGELAEFVKSRLTGYKRPKQIVTALSLPAASTGKLLKHKMIETFADQLD